MLYEHVSSCPVPAAGVRLLILGSLITLEMSSSWLARCALQWMQL